MKKILTLLFCVGAAASTFAQTNSEQSRDIILGKRTGSGSTPDQGSKDIILGRKDRRVYDDQGSRSSYPSGTREQQVDQVNREYDGKIQSIRNNSYLSAAEKERAIRQLNNDRAKRIKAINSNRNDNRDRRYDDDNDRDHKQKKYKSNNGNHKGWDKNKKNKKTKSRSGDDDNND